MPENLAMDSIDALIEELVAACAAEKEHMEYLLDMKT